MSEPKANKLRLPPVKNVEPEKIILPYNGKIVEERGFTFSFACFDRTHKLFNLGGKAEDGTVGGAWFIELLDCLKSISNMTFDKAQTSMHDLHRVKWKTANANRPESSDQCEYWQFRINKSKGRVTGVKIGDVFYVVWLDPYHNMHNSEGYGGVKKYHAGKSEYELREEYIAELEAKCKKLEDDLAVAVELLYDKT